MTTLAHIHSAIHEQRGRPHAAYGDVAVRAYCLAPNLGEAWIRYDGHSWTTIASSGGRTPSFVYVYRIDNDHAYSLGVRLAEKYGVPLLVIS